MQEKFTRQAVNALKLARSTVQSCKHTYIGTEHILVGLLKEKEDMLLFHMKQMMLWLLLRILSRKYRQLLAVMLTQFKVVW